MNISFYKSIGLKDEFIANIQQIESISKKILYHIPMTLGEFSDHGVGHAGNIFKYFINFLNNFKDFPLTEEERYIICLAIWTHDLGNIIDRIVHEEHSINILEKNDAFLHIDETLGKDIVECLKFIIRSHRSKFDLVSMKDMEIHQNIRLKLICSIFRLLDNCDITASRISLALYSILNEHFPMKQDSVPYWEAHKSIISVVLSEQKIVIVYENYKIAKILIDDLEKNLAVINKVFEEFGFPVLETDLKSKDDFSITGTAYPR